MPTLFHNGTLAQQVIRIPSILTLKFWPIWLVCGVSHCGLLFSSFITNETKDLFMCLLTIWISLFLFWNFFFLTDVLFSFSYLSAWILYILWKLILFQLYVLQISYIFCGFFFSSLCVIWWTKILNFRLIELYVNSLFWLFI